MFLWFPDKSLFGAFLLRCPDVMMTVIEILSLFLNFAPDS
jgi:hypothetical protein